MALDIDSIVESAFDSFADFVVTATLTKPGVSGFDFSTGSTVENSTSLTIEVIPIETKLDSDSTLKTDFLAKRKDFNLSNYNTITVGSDIYRIESQELYEGVVLICARRSVDA